MLSIIVAILLALGCPVPPNLIDHHNTTVITAMGDEDVDSGGDVGHIPPPPPPPTGH